MVSGNIFKKRLEMREKGQFRRCIGIGLGALDILEIPVAVGLEVHILTNGLSRIGQPSVFSCNCSISTKVLAGSAILYILGNEKSS